ncbi:MAG TPA: CcmD family protein [Bacteroidales bacterium]|nr:CcmD family protein [Bacteroidales bacterium]HPS16272.1 CcmD family protein [Bacteroidales bacterium]
MESINVVIIVLSVVFVGIAVFLFAIDKKVGKLEKKITENHHE